MIPLIFPLADNFLEFSGAVEFRSVHSAVLLDWNKITSITRVSIERAIAGGRADAITFFMTIEWGKPFARPQILLKNPA